MLSYRESTFGLREAISAQFALIRAAWDVRTRRTGRFLSLLSESRNPSSGDRAGTMSSPIRGTSTSCESEKVSSDTDEGRDLTKARSVGDAVRYVAVRGFFHPSCLVQAVALKRLLDSKGLTGGRIRVGVQGEGDQMAAHAWVDFRGHVVGDFPERIQQYRDLRGLRVHSESGNGSHGGGDGPASP